MKIALPRFRVHPFPSRHWFRFLGILLLNLRRRQAAAGCWANKFYKRRRAAPGTHPPSLLESFANIEAVESSDNPEVLAICSTGAMFGWVLSPRSRTGMDGKATEVSLLSVCN